MSARDTISTVSDAVGIRNVDFKLSVPVKIAIHILKRLLYVAKGKNRLEFALEFTDKIRV